jgi:hypothetical protein
MIAWRSTRRFRASEFDLRHRGCRTSEVSLGSGIAMTVVLCNSRAEETQGTPRQPIEPAGKAAAHEADVSALLGILEPYRR